MGQKKLYRSIQNRMLTGVCGGIGEYFNIDPTIIRLIWAVLTLMTVLFPCIFAYIIASFIIPEE